VKEINPVLRGWANYFKISYHSQKTFISIGHLVWISMMKWVARKHPSQSIYKTVSKYLVTEKTNSNHKWVWGKNKYNEDKVNKLVMLNISEVKPIQHPLLKLDKNPYLLSDRKYFDKRIVEKNSAKFREVIFAKYEHQCPLCLESLHNGEKVELHHILPVKDGGKYTIRNIQPLHQLCHISITHSAKTRSKLTNTI